MSLRRTPWPGHRPEHERRGASWRSARWAAPLVNAQARRGAGDVVRAERLLHESGVPVATSGAVHQGPRRPATVRAALAEGHDLLILDGGDGSVGAGVDELAHHGSVRHSGAARSRSGTCHPAQRLAGYRSLRWPQGPSCRAP